ncbi:MAG: sensor histidine kinase [Anaerolineaceae bacterium]
MNNLEPQNVLRPIRQRLFLILLLAMLAVVILVIVTMLGSTFFFINRISNPQPPPRSGIASVLEAYYEGSGTWDGVEVLLQAEPPGIPEMGRSEWKDSVLLDDDGIILLDHGSTQSPRIGNRYRAAPQDIQAPLLTQDRRQIGTLVSTSLPAPANFIPMLLAPLGLVSIFLAILTLVIGFLLTERLINPLAEVIAAARSVASGVLSTRVRVSGPDDLRVLSDSFNQMAGTLEKNDREQRDLITDIAHELRTPLSIIQGKLEGISDGIYPATKEQLAPVLEETYLLEKIIEDLDMLAQAASRQLHFTSEPFQLESLAGHVIDSFKGEASGKGIAIALKDEPDLPAVLGDSQRTGQVISNLIGNSLRYIPSGCHIHVGVTSLENMVQMTVTDDGPGIPAGDLPFIFDRLWRGEKSRSRMHGGAGLGLAIARQFIEIQGGKIWAQNLPSVEGLTEPAGLQVGFWLPKAENS